MLEDVIFLGITSFVVVYMAGALLGNITYIQTTSKYSKPTWVLFFLGIQIVVLVFGALFASLFVDSISQMFVGGTPGMVIVFTVVFVFVVFFLGFRRGRIETFD